MYRTLTKYSIKQYFSGRKTGRGKLRIPQWVTQLLSLAVFTLVFFSAGRDLAYSLNRLRLGWLYFCLLYLLQSSIVLMSNVVLAQNSIFKSKYNDLLLSMPVKDYDILLSRLLEVVAYDWFLGLMVWLPGSIGYFTAAGFDFLKLVFIILNLLISPLFLTVLGTIIGYVVTKISALLKNPTLVKVVLTFALIGIYYYWAFNNEDIVESLVLVSNNMKDTFNLILPVSWLGHSIENKDIIKYLLFALFNVIPFALMILIMQKDYHNVMTQTQNKAVIKYVKKDMKARNIMTALLMREFKRWKASYTYLINTVIGLVILAAGSVYVLFRSEVILQAFLFEDREFTALFISIFMMLMMEVMISSYVVSSASVSMDGPNVELIRSLPVSSRKIVLSKLLFHCLMCAPAVLLASLVLIFKFQPDLFMVFIVLVIPQLFLFITGALGLCYNLKYHRLDWANEAQAVKRSLAVFVSIISGYLLIALQTGPYVALADYLDLKAYISIVCAVMVLIAAGLYALLVKWGAAKYSHLGEE